MIRWRPTIGDRAQRRRKSLLGLILALLGLLFPGHDPGDGGEPTTPTTCEGEPMQLTDECVDPFYDRPVLDVDLDDPAFDREALRIEEPVPHYYVSGHFEGTDARFSLYFPMVDDYEGRFFQYTHQLLADHIATDRNIAFAMDNGAYLVQSNLGGADGPRSVEDVAAGKDPSIVGYRANAAAAKVSREVASTLYDEDERPYGYLYGGSGGAYQTIASMQNTTIWDGGVPFVMGSPQAIPNMFTVRVHALRVVADGFEGVMDAIDPGGSGEPHEGLDEEQRAALQEAHRLGFPARGWFDHATLNGGALSLVAAYVPYLDPTYFEDFWNEPGYLGHDDPALADERFEHATTIESAEEGPQGTGIVTLSGGPDEVDITGSDLIVDGTRFPILAALPDDVVVVMAMTAPEQFGALEPGDAATIDNAGNLALQTYHRHQVPDPDRHEILPDNFPDMPAWDQFVDDDGEPVYPQRDVLVGPRGAFNGAGSISTGEFHGKMIGLQNMMDIDALPWNADWYKRQVHAAGHGDDFRLYYNDHADHLTTVEGARQARIVNYRGALEQAILDLVRWVEDGVEPPAETNYEVEEAQVVLPDDASARAGFQPVIELSADGGERAEVATGEPLTLSARIEVPEGAGSVVDVEWDFEGVGAFVDGELERVAPGVVEVQVEHVYTEPGTYFPAVRATAHRDGDTETEFARVQNLGRARVVVE